MEMSLRMAGRPPMMAHSQTDTRTLQFLRKERRTSTFSLLQQPPSMSPTSTGLVKVLMSSMGDLLNSTRSMSPRIRSSMSRRDMWQPKQPARDAVAMTGLLTVLPPCPFFDVAPDRDGVVFPPPDRDGEAGLLPQDGAHGAYVHGPAGLVLGQVGGQFLVHFNFNTAAAVDRREDLAAVLRPAGADAAQALDAAVPVEHEERRRGVDVAARPEIGEAGSHEL